VIGLIRFLPVDVPLERWGCVLAAIGFFSAFYDVALGLTWRNPKVILAYPISQMGVIAAALSRALVIGHTDASLNVAFYTAPFAGQSHAVPCYWRVGHARRKTFQCVASSGRRTCPEPLRDCR
jgi:formate hydrogenlyase subunit 3/multisubunit Na+/H+ antiporter MnhD subunit